MSLDNEVQQEAISDASSNYQTFRECVSEIVIQQLSPVVAPQRKKRGNKSRRSIGDTSPQTSANADTSSATGDVADLAEFIEYLAEDLFGSLPLALQELSYAAIRNDQAIAAAYTTPLPASTLENVAAVLSPSALDSLTAYGILPPSFDAHDLSKGFLDPVLSAYTSAVTAPPPAVTPSTRATACEICERDWIPLTYHHLIPRSTHDRVLKRGWHEEWRLNSVAWLCRSCHSMVHRLESNESLARNFYSVDLLLEREQVRSFAKWVSNVRWKAR